MMACLGPDPRAKIGRLASNTRGNYVKQKGKEKEKKSGKLARLPKACQVAEGKAKGEAEKGAEG